MGDNRVQAVERALGRVQNFVADLAGSRCEACAAAACARSFRGPSVHQAFAALREAGVIDGELCRRAHAGTARFGAR